MSATAPGSFRRRSAHGRRHVRPRAAAPRGCPRRRDPQTMGGIRQPSTCSSFRPRPEETPDAGSTDRISSSRISPRPDPGGHRGSRASRPPGGPQGRRPSISDRRRFAYYRPAGWWSPCTENTGSRRQRRPCRLRGDLGSSGHLRDVPPSRAPSGENARGRGFTFSKQARNRASRRRPPSAPGCCLCPRHAVSHTLGHVFPLNSKISLALVEKRSLEPARGQGRPP